MNRFNLPALAALLLPVACASPARPIVCGGEPAPPPVWEQIFGTDGAIPPQTAEFRPDPALSAAGWFWASDGAAPVPSEIRSEPAPLGWQRHLPGGRIEHLKHSDGHILLLAVEDLSHQVISRYEPPVVLFPPGAAPLIQKGRITVFNRHDPDQKRDEGTWEETSSWGEGMVLNLPGQKIPCRTLHRETCIQLKLARAQTRSTEWHDSRGRWIGAEEHEHIQGLLVNSKTRRRWLAP